MSDSPYQSPQTDPYPYVVDEWGEGDATGGIIPYKNPCALIAYYMGLFSLFPILGLFLAIPAFILGVLGLQHRRQNPVIKGAVHAWIGIIMGGLFTVIWTLVILLLIVALVGSRAR